MTLPAHNNSCNWLSCPVKCQNFLMVDSKCSRFPWDTWRYILHRTMSWRISRRRYTYPIKSHNDAKIYFFRRNMKLPMAYCLMLYTHRILPKIFFIYNSQLAWIYNMYVARLRYCKKRQLTSYFWDIMDIMLGEITFF